MACRIRLLLLPPPLRLRYRTFTDVVRSSSGCGPIQTRVLGLREFNGGNNVYGIPKRILTPDLSQAEAGFSKMADRSVRLPSSPNHIKGTE